MNIKVMLLTATIPHLIGDSLDNLLKRMSAAWRSFTSDRKSKTLRANIELVGTIRNIEVTYGENGWHPHFHCLVFYRENGIDPKAIEPEWSEHWKNCAVKAGLRAPSNEHGLQMQGGNNAATYVSKWGLEHEMTKSMAKIARRGGRTPFDIAQDFDDGVDVEKNAALWREFALAFHGARQLFWSSGLKTLFSVEEKDDEALALEEDDRPADIVVQLTWPEWRAIRARHRAVLLDLVETAPHLVSDWIAGRVFVFEQLAAARAATLSAVG